MRYRTREDLKALKKDYTDMTDKEKRILIDIYDRMTIEELEKFKDDLRRIEIGEQESYGNNAESAGEIFENKYDYEMRKKKNELTEEEIEREKAYEEQAKKNYERSARYTSAKKTIKDRIDDMLYENRESIMHVVDVEVDTNGLIGQVDLQVDITSLETIRQGHVTTIRNMLADEVIGVLDDVETIKIDVSIAGEKAETYRLEVGEGWNK